MPMLDVRSDVPHDSLFNSFFRASDIEVVSFRKFMESKRTDFNAAWFL